MAKDKRPKDDLRTAAKSRTSHMPAETAGGRLDESTPLNDRDLTRRGREASGPMTEHPTDRMPDEPVEPPARMKQPASRAEKQRNQPRR